MIVSHCWLWCRIFLSDLHRSLKGWPCFYCFYNALLHMHASKWMCVTHTLCSRITGVHNMWKNFTFFISHCNSELAILTSSVISALLRQLVPLLLMWHLYISWAMLSVSSNVVKTINWFLPSFFYCLGLVTVKYYHCLTKWSLYKHNRVLVQVESWRGLLWQRNVVSHSSNHKLAQPNRRRVFTCYYWIIYRTYTTATATCLCWLW